MMDEKNNSSVSENLEDVELSVKSVILEKRNKKKWYQKIFGTLFSPFIYIYRFIKRKSFKYSTKITVTVSATLTVIVLLYTAVILLTAGWQLKGVSGSKGFLVALNIICVLLPALFCCFSVALGKKIAKSTVAPLQKITDEMKMIDGMNADKRLVQEESQQEFKDLVTEINRALDNLHTLYDRQNNFVSDASHELKTPLAVINGYADILTRWGSEDPAILKEGIEAISREAKFMEKLIKQLLLLSRLGRLSVAPSRFDLGAAVREIADSYRVLEIPHSIKCNCDKLIVYSDKNLITEAVRTLIDNAVKYTKSENGKIKIFVKSDADNAYITVRDNGDGIAPEDIDRIFDRFYRVDKTRGRDKGSSGLGLSICKSIVETLGGRIEVASQLSIGSAFTVILPKK